MDTGVKEFDKIHRWHTIYDIRYQSSFLSFISHLKSYDPQYYVLIKYSKTTKAQTFEV